MKRKVGYVPPKTITVTRTPAPVKNVPSEADFKARKAAKKDPPGKPSALTKEIRKKPINRPEITAKQVVAWINSHPLFKWSSMCFLIGINKGNFGITIQSEDPKIKPEIVLKIVSVISKYGFQV